MFARELINHDLPPLKPKDSGLKAIGWMDEFKVAHLPVVDDNGKLLGLISESDLLDINSPDQTLKESYEKYIESYVTEATHFFDILKRLMEHDLTVMPVLNKDESYLGCVTQDKFIELIGHISMINEPGSLIVLELNVNDYSLAELSRIVEGESAKIMGCYVSRVSDSTKMNVTLKLNTFEVRGIIQTFERYNYVIAASYGENDYGEDLRNRFDSFMNYLNI
ncbi:MAG: CBS domain-containing protein [Flavobacteriales bacterium]|nr:CBS domain-containing protein [Flavobacteriales bacterium]